MGQNMVGRIRFCMEAEAGSRIIMQHAEVLDNEGNVYFENLRSAKQTVTYIFRGGGGESFEPHFTFQGFRYVKLTECPETPCLESFTGRVIHTALEPTSHFQCSDWMVNQLQHNILWSQRGTSSIFRQTARSGMNAWDGQGMSKCSSVLPASTC